MNKLFKYPRIFLLTPFLFLLGTSGKSFGQIKSVESVGMTVKNIDSSVEFYTKVLQFEKVKDDSVSSPDMRRVSMKLGNETLVLTSYFNKQGRPIPLDMKSNDLYFQHIAIVVSDMDKAYEVLKKYMTYKISVMPETIPKSNAAAAGIRAFYFHDIDHHDLELIYFPKGKGQEKWQETQGKLFLGIDHTAIGVKNTEASLHFYRDLLGITRKGDSWNKGMEQMDLSNVKGASLHITGLRTMDGDLGIEFLQYLEPGPGKPYPEDTQMKDIWYWQITLISDQVESLYRKLALEHYHFISKINRNLNLTNYPTRNSDNAINNTDIKNTKESFIVQDPDGHALFIKN